MTTLWLAWLLAAPLWRWQTVPLDGGGPLRCVRCSPHEPGLVLAGGEGSGVHRSDTGGQSWQPSAAGLTTLASRTIIDLAWHPTNPRHVYAATAAGLYVSDDTGQSWRPRSDRVTFAPFQRARVLLTDAFVPAALYVATATDGVRMSTDGGERWTSLGLAGRPVSALTRTDDGVFHALVPGDGLYERDRATATWRRDLAGAFEDLATAPTEPQRRLVAAGDRGALLSSDGGRSWVNVTPAEAGERLRVTRVAVSPSHPWVGLFAGEARPGQLARPAVYLTLDSGATWQPLVTERADNVDRRDWWGEVELFGRRPAELTFDPRTARRVLLADGLTIWGTHDGAARWFCGAAGLRTVGVHDFGVDPDHPALTLLATAGAGLFRGAPETAVPGGQNASLLGDVPGVAVVRAAGETAVVVTRGRGIWRLTGPGRWTAGAGLAPGPLGRLLALPDGSLLADCPGHPPQVTRDAGESWSDWAGLPPGAGLPALLDPTGRLLAVADGTTIRLSRDGGLSWGRLDAALPPVARGPLLLAGGGSPPVLYAALAEAVWRTVDLGRTWDRLAARAVTALAVEPTTGRLYLATADPPEILATTDRGETLTVVADATTVPGPVRRLWPDPRRPGRLWVATVGGGALVGELVE